MDSERKRTTSFRISEDLDTRLDELARRKGSTRADIVREAVAEYIVNEGKVSPGSFVDLAGDLVGSLEGPEDLSTDPRYLDDLGR